MPSKYFVILSLLVIAPLFAFFLLGRRLVEADRLRTQQQFELLLRANLSGIDDSIADYFDDIQQRLLAADIDPEDESTIHRFSRSEPLVEQVLLIGHDGLPVYTELTDPYLQNVKQLIVDRAFSKSRLQDQLQFVNGSYSNLGNNPIQVIIHPQRPMTRSGLSSEPTSGVRDHGWYTWYWDGGIQLLHWQVLDDHRTLVVGLRRARWIADVISALPDSEPAVPGDASPAQIRLINSVGDVVYLWGSNTDLPKDSKPSTQLHLREPLHPWQLQHFGPMEPLKIGTSGTIINLVGTGGLLFLGLLALSIFLSREIARQTREARQRVNFVNQVSHELKTPLTNIRMYAELLENDLERMEADDEKTRAHLSVITNESSRLSRLIGNVLSFARTSREVHVPNRRPTVLDDVIGHVVEQFRPSLDRLGIVIAFDLDAPQLVSLDVDAFEQMLGNLVSNVEKYAAVGKHLRIASSQKNGVSSVTISDAGPGISPSFAKRIFTPFERASDHIVAATGTGIGLNITRALARRNGGDLVLVESAIGATFRLTLQTPNCEA